MSRVEYFISLAILLLLLLLLLLFGKKENRKKQTLVRRMSYAKPLEVGACSINIISNMLV